MTISAVILTKNSEQTIEACIKSLSWCTEVIVIDDASIDTSRKIAERSGAHVYIHPLKNDFSQQRNFGLEIATSEWVFFVDSDEVVPSSLREEIAVRIKNTASQIDGYYIKRIDSMWGKKLLHGEMGDIRLLRLAKKGRGKWEGKVHEVWRIEGQTTTLQHVLDHFPHPSLQEFLSEVNFYSTLRAEELYKKGQHVSFIDIIMYPKAKFIYSYIFKCGFLDGIPGLVIALVMSLHSFLVRAKLWQLQQTGQ